MLLFKLMSGSDWLLNSSVLVSPGPWIQGSGREPALLKCGASTQITIQEVRQPFWKLPGLITDSRYFDSSLLKITVIEQNTFTAAALSLWFVERMPSKPWFGLSGKTRDVSWRCSRSNNCSNMLCRSRACFLLILRRNAWRSHNVGIAIFTSNPTVCLSFLILNFSLSLPPFLPRSPSLSLPLLSHPFLYFSFISSFLFFFVFLSVWMLNIYWFQLRARDFSGH